MSDKLGNSRDEEEQREESPEFRPVAMERARELPEFRERRLSKVWRSYNRFDFVAVTFKK